GGYHVRAGRLVGNRNCFRDERGGIHTAKPAEPVSRGASAYIGRGSPVRQGGVTAALVRHGGGHGMGHRLVEHLYKFPCGHTTGNGIHRNNGIESGSAPGIGCPYKIRRRGVEHTTYVSIKPV